MSEAGEPRPGAWSRDRATLDVNERTSAMRRALVLIAVLTCAACAAPQEHAVRRNWFDDPFFRMSSAVPDCPLPAGPYLTERERLAQSHHRAERGTTCWLRGECDKPTAHGYDRDIARALQEALRARHPFAGTTTLWVTVQGRVVYIEGCAPDPALAAPIEAYVMALPHVQRAVAILHTDRSRAPPYRLRSDP